MNRMGNGTMTDPFPRLRTQPLGPANPIRSQPKWHLTCGADAPRIGRDIAVDVDVKDGRFCLVVDFAEIPLECVDGLRHSDISAVIAADDGLPLQVGDEEAGERHGRAVVMAAKQPSSSEY